MRVGDARGQQLHPFLSLLLPAGEEEPESMQYQYYSGLPLCAITLPSYLLSGEEVAYNCLMNDSKLVFVLPTCYVYGELELSCALGSILVLFVQFYCSGRDFHRIY